jgi:hypothetical protein
MNAQVFTVSISPTTLSKSDAAGVPDILDELRQIKEQNLEILRLLGVVRSRRWHNMQDAAQRLDRSAWTLRQLCNHGKINAVKGEDGQWRISADEMARLEQDGVPKLPQKPAK